MSAAAMALGKDETSKSVRQLSKGAAQDVSAARYEAEWDTEAEPFPSREELSSRWKINMSDKYIIV